MSDVSKYPAGAPCWVNLSTNDLERAKRFYTALLGWDYEEKPIPGGPTFIISTVHGRVVAGMMEFPEEMADQPVTWGTFIATDDVDATASAVRSAGGTVVQEATDIPSSGRMIVCEDNAGSRIGFWQAENFIGTELAAEAGTVVWQEVTAKDVPGAVEFYSTVCSLQSYSREAGNLGEYTSFMLNGQPVAGATAVRDGMRPSWMMYFAVPDCDAALAQARELGGSVVLAPTKIPFGTMATLTDPSGAQFSVLQM